MKIVKKNKKRLHERLSNPALRGLEKDCIKEGCLISQEEAIKSGRVEESWLDDEVWTSSWDTVIKTLKAFHPGIEDLKPKAKVKVTSKIDKGVSGEKNGKNI